MKQPLPARRRPPLEIVKKTYALLTRRKRWQLLAVMASTVLMALVATAGVASIMPFMAVVADPEIALENRWLRWTYDTFGFESSDSFLFALGVATLLVITVSNVFGAANTWVVARFTHGLNHDLSHRLFNRYLNRPYAFYLNRNSSGLAKNVLSEVSAAVNGAVAPMIEFSARAVVAVFLLALLVWIDPVLALIVAALIGGLYSGVYFAVKKRQTRLGREKVEANTARFQAAQEAFSGIKEVKVLGRESSFLEEFRRPSWHWARTQASNAMVNKIPKYALETVAFGGILIIVLYLLQAYEDFGRVLPILTLYVFAAYRLMPAFQVMFSSLVQVGFNTAALDDLHQDLVGDRTDTVDGRDPVRASGDAVSAGERSEGSEAGLSFRHEIRLEDVTFRYPGSERPALADLSLDIPHNATVGLVGHTGSGKTTLADLLLGLFEPSEGRILIDGVEIGGQRLGQWRHHIGYVPQDIFLADRSIRRNIAFGIPEDEIDDEQVRRAARIAHLDEFVRGLPEGYESVVGDRGVRLSGGQRQRIGIARAVYDDPDVLVLDEATSALDNVTEGIVMEAIAELSGRKTMILVAHRLSTVRSCDRIFVLEEGRLVGSGSYEELADGNKTFRAMAGAGVG